MSADSPGDESLLFWLAVWLAVLFRLGVMFWSSSTLAIEREESGFMFAGRDGSSFGCEFINPLSTSSAGSITLASNFYWFSSNGRLTHGSFVTVGRPPKLFAESARNGGTSLCILAALASVMLQLVCKHNCGWLQSGAVFGSAARCEFLNPLSTSSAVLSLPQSHRLNVVFCAAACN